MADDKRFKYTARLVIERTTVTIPDARNSGYGDRNTTPRVETETLENLQTTAGDLGTLAVKVKAMLDTANDHEV